jgi:hypothetical protein
VTCGAEIESKERNKETRNIRYERRKRNFEKEVTDNFRRACAFDRCSNSLVDVQTAFPGMKRYPNSRSDAIFGDDPASS